MRAARDVSRLCRAQVFDPDGNSAVIDVLLGYTDARPLEIRACLDAQTTWILSRDLIHQSLTTSTRLGIGDASFQTTFQHFDMILRGFDEHYEFAGIFTIRFMRDTVERFLDATEQICKIGSEVIEVDSTLAVLLG